MSEILFLEFQRSGPSIRAVLDCVRKTEDGQDEVVVGGPPQPVRHLTLTKLREIDPKLYADLNSVLERLEPIVRSKSESDARDPEGVRREANRVASARQELERRTEETNRSIDEAVIEVKKLQMETASARESFTTEMNQLISYTTAKKAEIAELEKQARSLRKSIVDAKQLEAPK